MVAYRGVRVLQVHLQHHMLESHRLARTDEHLTILSLERLWRRENQRGALEQRWDVVALVHYCALLHTR